MMNADAVIHAVARHQGEKAPKITKRLIAAQTIVKNLMAKLVPEDVKLDILEFKGIMLYKPFQTNLIVDNKGHVVVYGIYTIPSEFLTESEWDVSKYARSVIKSRLCRHYLNEQDRIASSIRSKRIMHDNEVLRHKSQIEALVAKLDRAKRQWDKLGGNWR